MVSGGKLWGGWMLVVLTLVVVVVVVILGRESLRRGEDGGSRGELSNSWHQGLSERCMFRL